MFDVGFCYENGQGVAKDMTKAFEWYLKAAENGHVKAMNSVGCCFCRGNGVSKDLKMAREWFSKAANNEAQSQKKQ